MPFLFKVAAILVAILIWKAVVGSFRKASEAMHDDSDDGDDEKQDIVPAAQFDLETQWREAAKSLFCTYDPGSKPNAKDASITGRFSDHVVTIKRFGHNYVRYFVAFRKAPLSRVCVVRDLDSIAERILDGHPVFPSSKFFSPQEPVFYCSAESEDAFARFLKTPSNRSAVLNLVRLFPAGMFNDEGVSVRLRAKAPDGEVLIRMIAIAKALENPSQTPMPDLLAAQKKGLLSVPADFRPAADADEEDTPKRFPPIQIEKSPASKTSKAPFIKSDPGFSQRTTNIRIAPEAKRTNRLAQKKDGAQNAPEPAAPEIRPETEILFAPERRPAASERVPEQTVEPAKEAVAPVTDDMSVESVCAALFSKSFPGPEERAAFEAMKGRRVRWSGELQTCMTFSVDFVFGSREGVKATILLCKLAQEGTIPVRIKAVAAFPPELRERLSSMKEKTIVFEGELFKFEPLTRQIFIQNASLES